MADLKQGDHLPPIFVCSVRIRDIGLMTRQVRWTIERSGGRGSGISVLLGRHDDDVFLIGPPRPTKERGDRTTRLRPGIKLPTQQWLFPQSIDICSSCKHYFKAFRPSNISIAWFTKLTMPKIDTGAWYNRHQGYNEMNEEKIMLIAIRFTKKIH